MNSGDRTPITILFLEENPILRDTFRIGIEAYWTGCVVIAPTDIRQAVPLLGQVGPSVVILDMDMSDADGWLVILRDVRKLSPVPVLLLGLREQAEVEDGVQGLGTVEYLLKPFGPEVLTRRIRSLLER